MDDELKSNRDGGATTQDDPLLVVVVAEPTVVAPVGMTVVLVTVDVVDLVVDNGEETAIMLQLSVVPVVATGPPILFNKMQVVRAPKLINTPAHDAVARHVAIHRQRTVVAGTENGN